MIDSDGFSDFSLRAANGYIELLHGGAGVLRQPRAGLAGLNVEETLTVLVARYDANGGNSR